jgi:heptosyltransferase-2
MVDHYLALSQLLSEEQATSIVSSPVPKLNVSTAAKQSVQAKLLSAKIEPANIYVMCPGAEYGPTKRWPTSHFAALAQRLITSNPNTQIIQLGSKGDHALAQEIVSQAKQDTQIHNWCGDTSLDEAIALIGMCKAVVSNDSGLMHIAAALKTPQVAIFGSSDPAHTPPLSDKAKVIWLNLPCSPCHKRVCPLGHLNCLNNILPEQVFATLNTLQP